MTKYLLITFILLSVKAVAQPDTIMLKDVPNYIGKQVTIKVQATHFDSREQYRYLYFGGNYPDQKLTIIVQRTNANKPVKLPVNILLGRSMVYITGIIINYTGKPDTSANPEVAQIKKEAEKDKNFNIGGQMQKAHFVYKPDTYPVNLSGKPVIIVTGQKQIGKTLYPSAFSLY